MNQPTSIDSSSEQVKKLREMTGAGMMDCKRALVEAKGNFNTAKEVLRKRGIAIAEKKSGRTANQGQIFSYIHHGGKIGVMIEINCETDFVARNSEFQTFGREIAMQVAATQPMFVTREEVDPSWVEKEKEIYREQVKDKPAQIQEQIIKGKLEKRYEEVCLVDQKFIRDDQKSIKMLLTELISKLGENVVIRRFRRFEVGSE
jgi:elongation factor Ts